MLSCPSSVLSHQYDGDDGDIAGRWPAGHIGRLNNRGGQCCAASPSKNQNPTPLGHDTFLPHLTSWPGSVDIDFRSPRRLYSGLPATV